MMVQDVDLFVLRPRTMDRRLEIVADGLPLFERNWHFIQFLCLHTTVTDLHTEGAANVDLVVQEVLRQKKERTCPELVGPNARCRLVVLAGERRAGGPRKFGRVWGSWRRLKLERCPRFSGNVLNSLGGFDGVLF